MSRARRCDPLVVPPAGRTLLCLVAWLVAVGTASVIAAEADARHDHGEAACSPF